VKNGRPHGIGPKRTTIQLRCTPEEKWKIQQAAQAKGMEVSDYLRKVALDVTLRTIPEAGSW
jgi:uncharacterized protein (DUF1778 family)